MFQTVDQYLCWERAGRWADINLFEQNKITNKINPEDKANIEFKIVPH